LSQREVPWDTRAAWRGILALIVIDFIFVVVVSALGTVVGLPNPLMVGVLTSLLYAGIAVLVYYLTGSHWRELAFNKFSYFKAAGYVALSFAGVLFFGQIWASLLKMVGISSPDSSVPILKLFGNTPFGFVVIFLLTVIIAPVGEEIFFRSFLYQAFRQRYGIVVGILISATIFALFHFSMFAALPVFIFIGALLGLMFETFHSVYPAIMLHALNNFFFFIIFVLTSR